MSAIAPESRPNIIFILADDLGWADMGCYGQQDYETPNLDRLARQGARFTQAYANSAVCSATRVALMTGRYQYRLPGGLEEPMVAVGNRVGLPPEHPTLPSLLKDAGYATALIGKWHLGSLPDYGPLKSGYEEFFGNYGGAIDYFTHKHGTGEQAPHDLYENETPVTCKGYYTKLLADKACQYILRQQQQSKVRPFFLSLHFTAPHWPWEGPDDQHVADSLTDLLHYDGGNLKTYGKMVGAMDQAVGQVMGALEEQSIGDNTIVVFTSDNGGERFSKTWPLTGQKTELLEGGIRIPTILRWSSQITPQVSHLVTISMDWLPTLLAAADCQQDPSHPSDGVNILPAILGKEQPVSRSLYWRYKAQSQRAARDGDWKYLKINENEFLFNLADDIRERANLRKNQPRIFERLRDQWEDWNRQQLPITETVFSHGVTPDIQADHYVPEHKQRSLPAPWLKQ